MAVPLLSLVIAPRQAAAVMLPLLCFTDLFGLRAFWGVYDRRNLPILLAGLLAGVIVGTLVFGIVRQDVLLPLVPIGVSLGVRIQGKLDDQVFYRISYWALLGIGLKLVYDGIS